MTLPDTALTFARECLGWEDASPDPQFPEKYIRKASNPVAEFAYTDLNAVMEAVSNWCASNRVASSFVFESEDTRSINGRQPLCNPAHALTGTICEKRFYPVAWKMRAG
jgi:hypothetical protein